MLLEIPADLREGREEWDRLVHDDRCCRDVTASPARYSAYIQCALGCRVPDEMTMYSVDAFLPHLQAIRRAWVCPMCALGMVKGDFSTAAVLNTTDALMRDLVPYLDAPWEPDEIGAWTDATDLVEKALNRLPPITDVPPDDRERRRQVAFDVRSAAFKAACVPDAHPDHVAAAVERVVETYLNPDTETINE